METKIWDLHCNSQSILKFIHIYIHNDLSKLTIFFIDFKEMFSRKISMVEEARRMVYEV